MKTGDGNIPVLNVDAKSIPEAFYKSLELVHTQGMLLRTEYDRKSKGKFIDPPGRDARVSIKIENPFEEPRYSRSSWVERGKYIAEFLGAKDHLVVPREELLARIMAGSEEFEATEWPYCYHQRLTAYPLAEGKTLDQLELILNKLAKDPITRRAVAITGVPEIDLFMKADMPCLREIQLRAMERDDGKLSLNMFTRWRSRDLYKAWCDNLVGISNLHARLSARFQEKTGREVVVGQYSEESGSLHIYGQDYTEKGMDVFFERNPTLASFIDGCWTSEKARDELIIPELEELKSETTWKFPPQAIALIDRLIDDFKTRRFIP